MVKWNLSIVLNGQSNSVKVWSMTPIPQIQTVFVHALASG